MTFERHSLQIETQIDFKTIVYLLDNALQAVVQCVQSVPIKLFPHWLT